MLKVFKAVIYRITSFRWEKNYLMTRVLDEEIELHIGDDMLIREIVIDDYNKCWKDDYVDNNRLNYPKGLIVNGTLDASNMNYQKRDDMGYLIGNEFIPLRKDFWVIPKLKINDSIETILITLGGNDLRNLTPKILELLNYHFPNINKKIIIADSFLYSTNSDDLFPKMY